MPYPKWSLPFIVLVVLLHAYPVRGDEGKELFDKECAGCHSVGGGDKVGPDLKGVTSRRDKEWLVRIIVEPDRLAAENDPTQTALAKKYHMQMPKLGVARDDAARIIAYLGGAAPAGPAAPAAAPPKKAAAVATPQLVARGRALFTGERPFAKGGPPCCACHRLEYAGINGGTLAGDLTGLYGRMGEEGLSGVLSSLQFPVMQAIFEKRPLTEDERASLLAMWKDAEGHREAHRSYFPGIGLGLFILFIIGFALYNRRAR